MAINQNIDFYGREVPKSASFDIKSKGEKYFGLNFPFGNLSEGLFLKKASGVELIKSNLRQLLLTRRGERVMRPNFGTNLKDYLMEPLDQALLNRIRREIIESVYRYASNVDLLKIQVIPIESATLSGGHALNIKLFCALKEDDALKFEVKVEIN
jgi:phage baseplate assembly protein W